NTTSPGLHILYRTAAGDAFHDSAERSPQPRCHAETRTQILEDLSNWSSDDNFECTVCWLHGPASAGKSAIAQSFCLKLEAEGRLGESFFSNAGGSAKKLIPTVVYQLARLLPKLNRAISLTAEIDPAIVNRSLSVQLQTLIAEPCRKIRPDRPVVIIIDGLDECEGQDVQQEIL
ncbi:hypothetical protein B0H13DRAFT_1520788, partial [Mycena leptocephala]